MVTDTSFKEIGNFKKVLNNKENTHVGILLVV